MKIKQKIVLIAILCTMIGLTQIKWQTTMNSTKNNARMRPNLATTTQIAKDPDFSLGDWSNTNGWSWGKIFYGVTGNIDAADTASYSTGSYARLTIHDDATAGADLEERVWIEQSLNQYYFTEAADLSFTIYIDYRLTIGSGSGWLSETTDVDLDFGFNGVYNRELDSYYDSDSDHASYDSGTQTASFTIDVNDLSYPYATNFDIGIRLDAASIAYEVYARAYIYSVEVYADVDTSPPPTPDLTCTDVWNTTDLVADEPAVFSAQIENVGGLGTTDPFIVELYLDDQYQSAITVASLASAGSIAIEFPSIGDITAGNHQIRVVVDASDTNLESDEGNNANTENFSWFPGPGTIVESEIITFEYLFDETKTYEAEYHADGIGLVSYEIYFTITFALSLPVEVTLSGKDYLRTGIAEEYIARISPLPDQATWDLSIGGGFDFYYDVLGIYGHPTANGQIDLNGFFTTPLERYELPFGILSYPIFELPSIASLDLSITPVLNPSISADIIVDGQGVSAGSSLVWDSYTSGAEKRIPVQAFSNATEPDLSLYLDNFDYNVDLEFDWALEINFAMQELNDFAAFLEIPLSYDLFTWPDIRLGHLDAVNSIELPLEIHQKTMKSLDITVHDAYGDPINQHDGDWCTVVLYETFENDFVYYSIFKGIVKNSQVTMNVINERYYCWDVYIDGVIIATGTRPAPYGNGDMFYVDDTVDEVILQTADTHSPLEFNSLEFHVFNDASYPWTSLATSSHATVLSFYNQYNNGVSSEWVVVGKDPATAGLNNTFAKIDASGKVQMPHTMRTTGEYYVRLTEGYNDFPWNQPTYWNDYYFTVTPSNQGILVLHGTAGSNPTLEWDQTAPQLTEADISLTPAYSGGDTDYVVGLTPHFEISPSDDIGLHKVSVRVQNQTYPCFYDSAAGTWKLDLNLGQHITAENLTVIAQDYAGRKSEVFLTIAIDTTCPTIIEVNTVTTTNMITYTAEISDTDLTSVMIHYSWDNNTWATHSLDQEDTSHWSYQLTIPDGHTSPSYYLVATDQVEQTTFWDEHAPVYLSTSLSLVDTNKFELTWEIVDYESGLHSVAVSIDDVFLGWFTNSSILLPGKPLDLTTITLVFYDLAGHNHTVEVRREDIYTPDSEDSTSTTTTEDSTSETTTYSQSTPPPNPGFEGEISGYLGMNWLLMGLVAAIFILNLFKKHSRINYA